jgi:hypothetical protein
MTKLIEFSWPVHEGGYGWGAPVPGSYCPEDEGWYRPLIPVDAAPRVRRYEPLREHSALFRTFGDLDIGLEGEGIVKFANQYGLLGRPPAGYRLEVPGLQVADGFLAEWDLDWFWRESISSMRDLVHLWDLLRKDRKRLRDHVRWEGDRTHGYDRVVYDNLRRPGEHAVRVISSREARQDWLDFLTPDDLVMPALVHLMGSVNAWTRGLIGPRLQLDEQQERLVSRIVPTSLFGALWLQFHQAIVGETDFRQCVVCRGWFAISPRVNRASKQYCGDACRSQALRDRRKRAQQLHVEGKAPEQIAEELGSDVPTVRKWISNRKEE